MMNFTTLTKFRLHSVLLCKNSYVYSGLPSVFHNISHNRRSHSFQTSVKTAVESQTGLFRLISESTPVENLQNFVVNLHDTTGLPWWATIVFTTILARSCVTTPIAIYQQIIIGRIQNIKVELEDIIKELKMEVTVAIHKFGWNDSTAKVHFDTALKKQWTSLIIRDNCHPAKTGILLLFQLPLWVCLSVTFRNLVYMLPANDLKAHLIYSQLTTEGFGWIIDLTQADHYLIMPILLGLINLTIIETQTLTRVNDPSRFQRFIVNFFRCFSILMVPIAASLPSGVTLYWTTSSAYGLVHNLILMLPKVRRFCRIPYSSLELEKPYTHMYNNLKQRIQFVLGITK